MEWTDTDARATPVPVLFFVRTFVRMNQCILKVSDAVMHPYS